MTDYSGLINQLRDKGDYEPLGHIGWEAADALEAQAKEIAKKDARISELENGWLDEAKKMCARIAELEAALNSWRQWWELRWQDRRPDIAERCYRAACAALKGEKE